MTSKKVFCIRCGEYVCEFVHYGGKVDKVNDPPPAICGKCNPSLRDSSEGAK